MKRKYFLKLVIITSVFCWWPLEVTSDYFITLTFFQGQHPQPYVRPWQSAVPALEESVTTKIQFPSDDEETGVALIGYRGPQATVSKIT
jgi:hypothetical protein